LKNQLGAVSISIGALLAALGVAIAFVAMPGTALAWSLNAGCANGSVSGQFDIPSSYANNLPVYVYLFDGASNIGQAGAFYDGSGSGTGGHVFNYNISAAGHSGDLVVKLFYDGGYHESAHTNPDCAAPTPTNTPTSTPTNTPTATPTNTPSPTSTATATKQPNDPTSTPIPTSTTPPTGTTPTTNTLVFPSATATRIAQVSGVTAQTQPVVGVSALPKTGDGGAGAGHTELAVLATVMAAGALALLALSSARRAH
jgi:hypothetical protein